MRYPCLWTGIRRLEGEIRQVLGEMDDVLTRTACDFQDEACGWQDTTKHLENDISIAQGGWCVETVIDHLALAMFRHRPLRWLAVCRP